MKKTIKKIILVCLCVGACLFAACGGDSQILPPDGNDPAPPAPKTVSITVASCNLDTAGGGDKQKQAKVLAAMLGAESDLIGVQEETADWKNFLSDALETEGYARLGAFRGGPQGYDEANGIFYKIDRFTLKESGTFWLSDTPGVPSTAASWGALYPRICTWAVLHDKKADKDVAYFNTHFSYVHDVPVRKKSAELILSKIREKNLPSFFSGDLNFWRENEAETYKVLTDRLTDSFAAAAETMTGSTFHNYGKELGAEAEHPKTPIDYIFSSKDAFEAKAFRIFKENGPDFYSDHFFVSAKYDYVQSA